MHRTQIILEDWQYQVLRARAEREGRSMSAVVRDILQTALSPPAGQKSRLGEIGGMGEDTASYGRDHDQYLYGEDAD
ncbi:FitA-like ribbon-helix-helix domain-containing protein [Thiohalobacter thiocyanaticus]|uniref:FitA-like ribbon-helix-helix domain-containing protein n=1 Tax=Thiohalobacter thiocyanaticus TaxID=585455 RepID=UPI001319C1FA|nr:hypothetical protein [Thiohalobacter thiocyanaticus]